jgi:hypothetical protein
MPIATRPSPERDPVAQMIMPERDPVAQMTMSVAPRPPPSRDPVARMINAGRLGVQVKRRWPFMMPSVEGEPGGVSDPPVHEATTLNQRVSLWSPHQQDMVD